MSLIVDNLAAGASVEEILSVYPVLSQQDVRAALAYASALTKERYISLETEQHNEIQA